MTERFERFPGEFDEIRRCDTGGSDIDGKCFACGAAADEACKSEATPTDKGTTQ